jgi:multimeric flavodoxin WrbA
VDCGGLFRPGDAFARTQNAIRFSDELVDELLASDIIVIGAPMYNYSIPSTLKAYIDQIVRVGRTFTYPITRGWRRAKRCSFYVRVAAAVTARASKWNTPIFKIRI